MKLKPVSTVIVVFICMLLAYAFKTYSPNETKMMFTIGSFLFLLFSGIGFLSLSLKDSRTTLNIRTISGIFFFLGLALNIVGSFLHFKEPIYIITAGLLFLIYVLVSYSIAKQQE